MKARVKATGEIISVREYSKGFDYNGRQFINYEDTKTHKAYSDNQLDFDNTDNSPDDYWTRLEHQYAGMAMQGMVSNSEMFIELGNAKGLSVENAIAEASLKIAHALMEKLKEMEEK